MRHWVELQLLLVGRHIRSLLISSSGQDVPLMVYNWFTRVVSIVRPHGLGRVAPMMCIADICERAVSFGDESL
jgi:hypothetical protein